MYIVQGLIELGLDIKKARKSGKGLCKRYNNSYKFIFWSPIVKLRKKLRNKEVEFKFGVDREKKIHKKWEEVFAKNLRDTMKEEIYLDQFLWHVFSYETINCLDGEEARREFEKTKKARCYVFYQENNVVLDIKNGEKIKAEDLDKDQDIYIVDEDFTWTYVVTHESPILGPYFCRSNSI